MSVATVKVEHTHTHTDTLTHAHTKSLIVLDNRQMTWDCHEAMAQCEDQDYLWAWHGGDFDPNENTMEKDVSWVIGRETKYPYLLLEVI